MGSGRWAVGSGQWVVGSGVGVGGEEWSGGGGGERDFAALGRRFATAWAHVGLVALLGLFSLPPCSDASRPSR